MRDAALLLPLAGLLLLMPPYIRVFDQPAFFAGVPLLYIYIFCLWLVGILLSALLSRTLKRRLDAADMDLPDGADRRDPDGGPDDR